MPLYAKKSSYQEIKDRIIDPFISPDNNCWTIDGMDGDSIMEAHPQLQQDLKLIYFENWADPKIEQQGDLIYSVLSGGGDGDYPMVCIIFIDEHDEIRGYIPKDGNPYNHSRPENAGWGDTVYEYLGNEIDQFKEFKRQYNRPESLSDIEDNLMDYCDQEADAAKMDADIAANVVVR
jgi:hypothetical protein